MRGCPGRGGEIGVGDEEEACEGEGGEVGLFDAIVNTLPIWCYLYTMRSSNFQMSATRHLLHFI